MADDTKSEATYRRNQIEAAQKDDRYRRWLTVGQQFHDRYRLESSGLHMSSGMDADTGARGRMIYNLLWSNVQTMIPMLYSKQPEPYVYRKFHNTDPVARMGATITERAVMNDLELDGFDAQAEALALDFSLVGRPCMRAVYEHTTENAKIRINKEDREDGSPAFFTDDQEEIPQDLVKQIGPDFFAIDPKVTSERAPLLYHNWKDFLTGPARTWDELQKHGWIMYRTYMTKGMATKRFGKKKAGRLTYSYSPLDRMTDEQKSKHGTGAVSKMEKLAVIEESWLAQTREVEWTSPGYDELLDKQPDFLELVGFFNTPRPLLSTFTNESLIPVPDYAEYRTQATEMDQVTAKIEQIMEDVRAGGVYNGAIASLGNALRNKSGSYTGVDEWASFAQGGGMDGAVQEFQIKQKVDAVISLYEHRAAVKRDADEISGMIDLFRGQQTQKDETLGQSQLRSAMGGLRINNRQRGFQRYIRDALAMKAEIIVSKFDEQRILEMADLQALMNESPELSRLKLLAESPEGQQALATPQGQAIAAQAFQAAEGKQMALIQSALRLLKDDQMRTFRLDIETDATVALDEAVEKEQAESFVRTIGEFLSNVMQSEAMAQNPEMKGLAAEMLMFLVRRFKVGRSLEQKIESVAENMVRQPPQPQQPDPLTLDVQRQAKADEQDFQIDQEKNKIDAFEAVTDREKAKIDAVKAAQDAGRGDLELSRKILADEDKAMGRA